MAGATILWPAQGQIQRQAWQNKEMEKTWVLEDISELWDQPTLKLAPNFLLCELTSGLPSVSLVRSILVTDLRSGR